MKIISIILFLIPGLFLSQNTIPSDFKKIPEILDNTELLYPFIVPDKEYAYWRVLTNDPDPDKAVIYESQMPDFMTINEPFPEKGFFQKCIGEKCFSYILACKKERSVYFSTEQQLRDFIGTVDNLPEAILLARTYGFSVDTGNTLSSSYKTDNKHIELYLSKSKGCPEIKESYFIKINRKTGKLESKNNGVYFKGDICN
ncbi:hypothetical protein [Chryseobacterium kwangjuense]|uniref:Uncharacterized protein n=1 Tax=Chryseobacterium kwangjuense TaxID=267125 RepID=A0A135W8N0_9FLAO|nr:hypothetical protein [Chryseobacterium kwangjuense]KXH81288.1 hypothetical protein AU378_16390 [Chryseobacterium kwangjuense]